MATTNGATLPYQALYSVPETARLLNVSQRTIREWEYAGKLHAIRLGRRVMFPATTIDKALTQGVK